MSEAMTGGIIVLGLAVLGLMCCDRRTIVMIVIVGAMAAVLAYSHPGQAVGAEPAEHSTGHDHYDKSTAQTETE